MLKYALKPQSRKGMGNYNFLCLDDSSSTVHVCICYIRRTKQDRNSRLLLSILNVGQSSEFNITHINPERKAYRVTNCHQTIRGRPAQEVNTLCEMPYLPISTSTKKMNEEAIPRFVSRDRLFNQVSLSLFSTTFPSVRVHAISA